MTESISMWEATEFALELALDHRYKFYEGAPVWSPLSPFE